MSIITISLSLFIPILMSLFGLMLWLNPPKKMNALFGYRTKTSMSSQDAWNYAQKEMGKIWLIVGVITLIISYYLLNILSISQDIIVITLISLQMITLYGSYIFVERNLKKRF